MLTALQPPLVAARLTQLRTCVAAGDHAARINMVLDQNMTLSQGRSVRWFIMMVRTQAALKVS